MRKKSLQIALLIGIGLAAIQSTCPACSCLSGYHSIEEQIAGTNLIFIGRVLSMNLMDDSAVYTITFEVYRTWKGQRTSPIILRSVIYSSMCGYIFNTGWVYLVFSDGANASFCNPTYEWDKIPDYISSKLGPPDWNNPNIRPLPH